MRSDNPLDVRHVRQRILVPPGSQFAQGLSHVMRQRQALHWIRDTYERHRKCQQQYQRHRITANGKLLSQRQVKFEQVSATINQRRRSRRHHPNSMWQLVKLNY